MSWRAAMTLHMHVSQILLVMMNLNLPMALVCMLQSPPRNSTESEMTSSRHQDVTSFSSTTGANFSSVGPEVMSREPNVTSFSSTMPSFFSKGAEVTSQETPTSPFEGERSERNGTFNGDATDPPPPPPPRGEFQWDSSIQGLLLSSNTMLAFITPLFWDILSRRLGGKKLIMGAILLCACLTLLQPLGARLSPYALLALRLMLGMIMGMKFPLLNEVFSWWAPNSEKVTMVSFAYSGVNTASVLVSLTSGFLCSISLDNGWPFIFYLHGSLTILWCILWHFTGSMKPEDHPFISEKEKQYIIKTRFAMDKNQKRSSPPYRRILSSVPVWGCLIMFSTHTYSFLVILSYMPMYLNGSLGFSIEQVGLISSVTYVVRFLGVIMWGQVSNLLLKKTRLQTTACRKLPQCTGFYLSALGLIALSFVRGKVVSVVLLTVVLACQSCTSACVAIIPLDMGPRYAGFVTGLINCVCTIVTLPGPLLTASMVRNGTMEEWRTVFLSVAGVVFVGTTCFLFMGSSQLQSWAMPDKNNNSKDPPLDTKGRKVSVLSVGLPTSPTTKQRRFNFSLSIDTVNFNEARMKSNGRAFPISPSLALDDVALSVISSNIVATSSAAVYNDVNPFTFRQENAPDLEVGTEDTGETTLASSGTVKWDVSEQSVQNVQSSSRDNSLTPNQYGISEGASNFGFDEQAES